jgi:hypothetical protein
MRSIRIAAVILAATIALTGCKSRKGEPIPGPRAAAEAPPSVSPAAPAGTRPYPSLAAARRWR